MGDVAIRGDRIERVGSPLPGAKARRVIDARGLVVAPGFIDMHSHSDMTLFEDGAAPEQDRQGVTTEILGEDTSAGPSKGKRSERTVNHGGKTIAWSTLGGYFEAIDRQGIAAERRELRRAGNACWNACRASRSRGREPARSRR